MVTSFGCIDGGVAGEVELHLRVWEPGATKDMWQPGPAKLVPPNGQLVVTVHLLSLSESESGVKVHGQTLTSDFVLHI